MKNNLIKSFALVCALVFAISCSNKGTTGPTGGGNNNGGGGGTTEEGYPSWYLTADQQQKVYTSEPVALFSSKKGDQYRIPAIIVADNGNIVAFGDARYAKNYDVGSAEALIDIVYRVSSDGGKNWTASKIIEPKSQKGNDGTQCKGDPIVFKAQNGDLVVLAASGGAWFGAPTKVSRIVMSRSTDDGVTWSAWKEVGEEIWSSIESGGQFKRKAFIASGRGLTMTTSKEYHGRMVAAMLIETSDNQNAILSIYSDDNGNTWKAGGSIIGPAGSVYPNEPKVIAQLENGDLLMSVRPDKQQDKGYRLWATSSDGGASWSELTDKNKALKDGDANGEGVRWTLAGVQDKNRILHANCSKGLRRKNVSISLSEDEGNTWKDLRTIYDGDSCYVSIDVLGDGTVITFAEENKADPAEPSDDNGWYDLVFRRYNMKALTGEVYDTAWYKAVK